MKGKIVTTNEFTEMSDMKNIDTSVEGRFGRLVVHCYQDDNNMDRFDVIIEPKSPQNEPKNVIQIGRERIHICTGLLDFNNISNVLDSIGDNNANSIKE